MFRNVFLVGALFSLLLQPVFIPLAEDWIGIYLEVELEFALTIGMLKVTAMFLCCFIVAEIPRKRYCTKVLSVIVLIASIVLTFNYIVRITEDEKVDNAILIGQHNDAIR